MANFPISGKPIPEINLRNISVKEWRALTSSGQSEEEGDATLAKVSGMSVEDVRDLPLYDYRALLRAVLDKFMKPLDDPKNSQSESI